jgi:hypothetical protein
MPQGKAHQVWIEQCDAAQTVRARFGLRAAFDYLVAEKLLNFAGTAVNHADFGRELPQFVSEVRRMFTPEETEALEHYQQAPIPGSDVEHVQGRQVAGSARHVADHDIGIAGNEPGQMPRHQTRAQVVSAPRAGADDSEMVLPL